MQATTQALEVSISPEEVQAGVRFAHTVAGILALAEKLTQSKQGAVK